MCRGVPGRVVAVDGWLGTVDFWGTERVIRLDLLEEAPVPGDHVLCHQGFAQRRIPPEDVGAILAIYGDVFPSNGAGGDG